MNRKHLITPADVIEEAYLSKIDYLVGRDREELIAALIAEYDELLRATPAGSRRR